MIKLIVGLGNPGKEYSETRHNAGFWFVDSLVNKLGGSFVSEAKYFASLAKLKVANRELFILKPQTYMNLSGKSVQALANFYKILPEEILVAHDELDLPTSAIKLKFAGGNGGHNGLKDIDRVIGKNYWRLRIGIGHPGDASKVASYVLNNPKLDDRIDILANLDRVLAISDYIINADFANAQKILHTK
ncbi:MAG: hypothetical protein RLZZ293_198 [Pseudomonadota bacterium]